MFFKNIRLFALTETFPYSQDELETQLGNQLFAPCSKFEKSASAGSARWVTRSGVRGRRRCAHAYSRCR